MADAAAKLNRLGCETLLLRARPPQVEEPPVSIEKVLEEENPQSCWNIKPRIKAVKLIRLTDFA